MTPTIAATLGVLLVAGIGYAAYIARWPFPSGLTWLSVVIGCCVTNLAVSVVTWELTGGLARGPGGALGVLRFDGHTHDFGADL